MVNDDDQLTVLLVNDDDQLTVLLVNDDDQLTVLLVNDDDGQAQARTKHKPGSGCGPRRAATLKSQGHQYNLWGCHSETARD